jgi:hypothetical protein
MPRLRSDGILAVAPVDKLQKADFERLRGSLMRAL